MISQKRFFRVFVILNLLQAALVGAIPFALPSRAPMVNGVLYFAAALMVGATLGLLFGGQTGRKIAVGLCALHGLIGTAFSMLICGSASYLYGIYGRHGQTVGTIAFVLVGVVFIVFWLLPAHEIWFLKRLREE